MELFWVVTQGVVVISYRRFVTTYLAHLQGSRIEEKRRRMRRRRRRRRRKMRMRRRRRRRRRKRKT